MAKKSPLANIWDKYKVIIIIAVAVILLVISPYNGLVSKQETVNEGWANVETQYQRRFDLIPNLVETVKGFAAQEADVFKSVTEARSAWKGAANRGQQIAAAGMLETGLGRLLATVENYPNLKSNENFLSLQAELAGTENRISVARTRYNETVKKYNTYRRTFPRNMAAGIFGFEAEEMFEADQGASDAVKVDF